MTLEWGENPSAGFIYAYDGNKEQTLAVVDLLWHDGHQVNLWDPEELLWEPIGHFTTVDEAKAAIENCKEIYL